MDSPLTKPGVTGIKCIESKKRDDDRAYGTTSEYIYEQGGKYYRVTNSDLHYTGTWTNKPSNTWSPPEEITPTQYKDLAALALS